MVLAGDFMFRVRGRLAFALILAAPGMSACEARRNETPESTLAAETTPAAIVTPSASCNELTGSRTIDVADFDQLKSAMTKAQPGDLIRVAPGRYIGSTIVDGRSGRADARITLCGSEASIIDGGGLRVQFPIRLVNSSYWTIQGFTITNGMRAIGVTGGSHNILSRLSMHTLGQEAVFFQNGSTHNLLEGSRIRDTGLLVASYGEGLYIGTDKTKWANGMPDPSDYNQVIGNTFGPDVRGEAVDVKDGTQGGVIRGNTFDADGSAEDDIIDLKGNGYLVENNVVTSLPRIATPATGFRVRASVSGWGQDNVLRNNVLTVNNHAYYAIHVGFTASGTVVSCSNKAMGAKALSNVSCTPSRSLRR
jgi:hypothetical protein